MITATFSVLLVLELTAFAILVRRVRSGWLGLVAILLLFVANMTLYLVIVHLLR